LRINFEQKALGDILGEFFTNWFGHHAYNRDQRRNQFFICFVDLFYFEDKIITHYLHWFSRRSQIFFQNIVDNRQEWWFKYLFLHVSIQYILVIFLKVFLFQWKTASSDIKIVSIHFFKETMNLPTTYIHKVHKVPCTCMPRWSSIFSSINHERRCVCLSNPQGGLCKIHAFLLLPVLWS
jgi:hypothetical protein